MVTITVVDHGSKGRIVPKGESGAEAEMTFSRASNALNIIEHTGVRDALRGTSAGLQLVTRALEGARAGGWKILPPRPFAAARFGRHPERADVANG